MKSATKKIVPALLAVLSSACAHAPRPSPEQVRIVVHNPDANWVTVRACGPVGCSDFRTLGGNARTAFLLEGRGGTRAVVEGKRGDRYVARHPVDFTSGATFYLELTRNLQVQ